MNITVGLPVIRTSVDHRTAFDIAGKGIAGEGIAGEGIAGEGIADKRSLVEALR